MITMHNGEIFKYAINAVHHPLIKIHHVIKMIEPGKFTENGYANLVYSSISFEEMPEEDLMLRFRPEAVYYMKEGYTSMMASSLKGYKLTGMWEIGFETESDLIAFKLKYQNDQLIVDTVEELG